MEGKPNSSERGQEHIPTSEEVESVFKQLSEKKFVETRRIVDEKGLCILDVEVDGDLEGQTIEYGYRRTLRYLLGVRTEVDTPEIHVTVYQDGTPIDGTSAARWVDGKWKIF